MLAILGAGIGFGVGYGAGLLGQLGGESAAGLFVFYLPLLIIAAVFAGKFTKGGLAALIFFVVGLPCIGVAVAKGLEWRTTWQWGGLSGSELVGFTPLYPAVLAIPFAAFGALIGYTIAARRLRPPMPVEERERAEESKAGFEEEQRRQEEERRTREEEQRQREEARARFERESRVKETYYDILRVSRNATQDEIKRAYHDKIKEYHPDIFMNQPEWVRKQAEQMSKKLNEAYEVLSDPNKREEYDDREFRHY